MSHFTCQSKSFICIFFTCQVSACELQLFSCHDLANDIKNYTYKLSKLCSAFLKHFCNLVSCRFQVYTTQDTTGMIKAFLQVNCRFQVYTTQDTKGMIRAFLQVNCRFQVYTTQDTTGMIRTFLQVNCGFQVYTTQGPVVRSMVSVNQRLIL